LLGDDFSVTAAALTIVTLITINLFLGKLKTRFPYLEHMAEGWPMILVENGNLEEKRMKMAGISKENILDSPGCHRGWSG
jgi:uncharacterized membrane protein YcaP (DUF421 family)